MAGYRLRSGVLAVAVVAACAGCASKVADSASGAGAGSPTSDSGCGGVDPGFCGESVPDSVSASPTDTAIPGVIMTPPSYVNESEVAEPSHSPPPCPGNSGSGFSMSIADGTPGYATPQKAIDAFVADHQDYATGATAWRIVYGMEMTATTSGQVSLDILSLPNANWVVDAGERC